MLYQKNLPLWERWLRVLGGIALVGYGLFGTPSALVMGIALFSAAAVIVTGFVGYCPACAMVGRKPIHESSSKQERTSGKAH
jgi:hypothetical protein